MNDDWSNDWEPVFAVLANDRRRRVVSFLRDTGAPATVDDIAAHLVGDSPSPKDLHGMRILLYHVDLPKLRSANLVEWDGRGDVSVGALSVRLPAELLSVPTAPTSGRHGGVDV